MKNKKIISLMLVSVLLFTSITVMGQSAVEDEEANGRLYVNDIGSITTEKVKNREIYFIDAKEGKTLMDMHFDRYLPLNLPEEYKEEGLEVEFTGKVSFRIPHSQITPVTPTRLPLFILLLCIYHSALPVLIEEIHLVNEPELVELTLEADPLGLTKEAFKLSPKPVKELGIKDGKIHAVYEKGTEITVTAEEEMANEEESYVFDHWSKMPVVLPEDNDNPLVFVIEKDESIIGLYELVEDPVPPVYYNLDISVEGEGTTDPEPGVYKHEEGTEVELCAIAPPVPNVFPVPPHSEFSHWMLNDEICKENPITVEMGEDKELVAHFIWVEPENIPPVAEFTYEPEEPVVDEEITLTSTSYDSDGEIVEWKWSCTNGNSFPIYLGEEEEVSFTPDHAGIYTVCLEVTDNDGLKDQTCKEIQVTEQEETDLVFDILPLQDGIFKSGETIKLKACLINKGEETVTVSEMSFAANSLQIEITTPDEKTVSYIGQMLLTWPGTVELEPNEPYVVDIELDENFGYQQEGKNLPYDFSTVGTYTYKGLYNSWVPGYLSDERWVGKLHSQEHSFIVEPLIGE